MLLQWLPERLCSVWWVKWAGSWWNCWFCTFSLLIGAPENLLAEQNVFCFQILGYRKVISERYEWHFHRQIQAKWNGRKVVSGRCFKFTRVHPMGLVCPSVQIFGLVFLQRFLCWLLSCSLFNAPLLYCELYSWITIKFHPKLHYAKFTKKVTWWCLKWTHVPAFPARPWSRHIKL